MTGAGIPDALIDEHLSRLEDAYFERFSVEEVAGHVQRAARLSQENPVEVIFTYPSSGRDAGVTIISYDATGVFALITGVLAAMEFGVNSGDIFTYTRGTGRRSGRRLIVDHFMGKIHSLVQRDIWESEARSSLSDVLRLAASPGQDAGSLVEARSKVNEMVTLYLMAMAIPEFSVLYPVEIKIDNAGARTTLRVVSQDTPAFLYSMSNALALQGVSIERLRIRTIGGRIEDSFEVAGPSGGKIADGEAVDRLKFSVLLTKQFTYFLGKAPDPFKALSRFEQLVTDSLKFPKEGGLRGIISNPNMMGELAKLLGASDFLWEDFIRLQYEALLPIMRPKLEGGQVAHSRADLRERLGELMRGAGSHEERKRILNDFKNRELFLIDLDHILSKDGNFRSLSERLTILAEVVLGAAMEAAWDLLSARYGRPRTVAGIEAGHALFGLGKFGGAALGYASDIELLLIYSDNGQTDGAQSITNGDFHSRLAQELSRFIEAKREGIFRLDFRLRPDGNKGAMAVSLENFCRYYGPDGNAHSYEILALIRLRAICGDKELGGQVERLRDSFVYNVSSIKLEELRELRERQFREKVARGACNAKFSPGALVDLEYTTQILQVMAGDKHPAVRTPRIHEALAALRSSGVLEEREHKELEAAYDFLRSLINGLRMLRGSAMDLYLPGVDSPEFVHLARRMGYEQKGELDPAQQLFIEFETRTAMVRAFVERHLGKESLPTMGAGNVADILVNDRISAEDRLGILRKAGFESPERALTNVLSLAGDGARRGIFTKLAVLACEMLRREPSPDMALNNWERFVQSLPAPESHYSMLFAQPKRFAILLGIFSRSQFLSDALIRNPEFFEWVTSRETLYSGRGRGEMEEELREASVDATDSEWLRGARLFRRREMLRVGTRDMCLGVPLADVMLDLSNLAESIVQVCLERHSLKAVKDERGGGLLDRFCVLAFGKLGGQELNYSSDIDLLGIYDDPSGGSGELYSKAMERVRDDLSRHTEDGYAYRVDLRLRPYGRSGSLAHSLEGIAGYYESGASPWEIQALLKLRPIAGNLELGRRFLDKVRHLLVVRRDRDSMIRGILKLREKAIEASAHGIDSGIDVKNGHGGIRDIEFLIQGLQLLHCSDDAGILDGNTLRAIGLFGARGIIGARDLSRLAEHYVFLRRVEHHLQILEDRQIHSLPDNPVELTALARRVIDLSAGPDALLSKIELAMRDVRELNEKYLSIGMTE